MKTNKLKSLAGLLFAMSPSFAGADCIEYNQTVINAVVASCDEEFILGLETVAVGAISTSVGGSGVGLGISSTSLGAASTSLAADTSDKAAILRNGSAILEDAESGDGIALRRFIHDSAKMFFAHCTFDEVVSSLKKYNATQCQNATPVGAAGFPSTIVTPGRLDSFVSENCKK